MRGCVFINYRGVDSRSYGAWLYTDLVRRFGKEQVFLDAESIPAGEDYVQELLSRVRSAAVVLAVVGPSWLTAIDAAGRRSIDDPEDWIRRELVAAFTAKVPVIPVLIDDAVLPAAADLPGDIARLSRCQARHLRRREPTSDLDRLAADLVAIVPELATAEQVIAESGTRDVLNRVEGDVLGALVQAGSVSGGLHIHLTAPDQTAKVSGHVQKLPADTEVFVGREDELNRLQDATRESDRVVVVAMHGLGGVGKSTLAARFADLHADEFSITWWMTADSVPAIESGLAELATALNPVWSELPSEQRTERAVVWLANHTGWLLILDNLATPADARPLLERVRSGTVLITSRQTTGWRNITTISLDVLSRSEALELLNRIVRVEWPDADLNGADRLCAELGCLPLAIEQASAYIAQTRITPSRYLELLAAFPARMFTATAEGGDAQRTMARIWHITLGRLADTPLAGRVLRALAWYAPDEIPRALIEPPGHGPDVSEALGRLAAYNMITLTSDTIRVHRLVQAVTRTPDPDDAHRQPKDITQACDTAAGILAAALTGTDSSSPGDWPQYRAVVPHALALFKHASPEADTRYHCVLVSYVGNYLHNQGTLEAAIALLDRAAHSHERLHGSEHPDTLHLRNNLARAYQATGDLQRAMPLFEDVLAAREQVLGMDHPHTLIARHNLAYACHEAGDLRRAILIHEAVLPDFERVLGVDHPDTLGVRDSLAYDYHAAGDLQRAIPLFETTLLDRKRILGADHPDTLKSRDNLASTYRNAGNQQQAISMHEEIVADYRRLLGDEHPDTLIARDNLATTHLTAGNLSKAIQLHEEVVADYKRILGDGHPDTLTARNNLANAYMTAGKLDKATRLHEEIVTECKRTLGEDHPTYLSSQQNLASLYLTTENPSQAILLYEKTLAGCDRVFSEDHPRILSLRNNLAGAYLAAGERERALQLYQATLVDVERALGPNHPLNRILHNNINIISNTQN